MAAIPQNSNQPGLSYARFTMSGTEWEIFTFPSWVARVGIRTRAGTGYISRIGEGVFSAGDTHYHSIESTDGQYLAPLEPQNENIPRTSDIRLAHSLGNAGIFEFELLG